MGLCFLGTLYTAIRGWGADGRQRMGWHLAAAAVFAAGTGTKEVIVVAPLVVCLYDRFFIHASFKSVFRRSPWLYSGFFPGLLVLLLLVSSGRTAQWACAGGELMAPLQYLLVQPLVISHYLRLALWPRGLCFDYGFPGDNPQWWAGFPVGAATVALTSLALVFAAVVIQGRRFRPSAFAGIWFFLILAPTSSKPIREFKWICCASVSGFSIKQPL